MLAFKAKYDHTDPLFHQLNMLKIERIDDYVSLIFVYKSLKTIPIICSRDTFCSITIQDQVVLHHSLYPILELIIPVIP